MTGVAIATFRRMWTVTLRAYPWTYFTSTVLTGVSTILLAYLVFHGIGRGRVSAAFQAQAGRVDYVGYVAVGAVAYIFAVRVTLWIAKALLQEEREGTIAALAVSPARRLPYLLGFAAFAVASTMAEVLALAGTAALLGVRLPEVDPVGLLATVAVFAVATFSLSVVLGVVMLFLGEAHISQNTCFLVMGLLSGFGFPRAFLPDVLRWLGEALPVTPALEALRDVTDRGLSADAAARLGLALAVSAAYLVIGFALLPRAEQAVMERTF